jgi:hypothetical protein
MNSAIRLLDYSLEEKLDLQGFIDSDKTILRFCCMCDSGISKDNKPIYYKKEDKIKLIQLYKFSHGYCINCLKIIYKNTFKKEYEP